MDLTPGAIGCALSHMQSLDLEKKPLEGSSVKLKATFW